MKIGMVFAGQGSQKEKMGKDLYDRFEVFRETIDRLEKKIRIKHLCFEADISVLSETENTQPAMLAFQLATYDLLIAKGIRASALAGLSLGEYSALAASGLISYEDAIDLVAYRGQVMAEASEGIDTSMYAILGLEVGVLEEICENLNNQEGIAQVCNYNCPGQTVVGGTRKKVLSLVDQAMKRGAKRAIELKVSGPFHTSLMEKPASKLRKKLNEINLMPMEIPVYFNVTGQRKVENEDIKDLLERQIKSPVYFEKIIRNMVGEGVEAIIEIGPNKSLAGFIKRIDRKIKVINIEDIKGLELLEKWIEDLR